MLEIAFNYPRDFLWKFNFSFHPFLTLWVIFFFLSCCMFARENPENTAKQKRMKILFIYNSMCTLNAQTVSFLLLCVYLTMMMIFWGKRAATNKIRDYKQFSPYSSDSYCKLKRRFYFRWNTENSRLTLLVYSQNNFEESERMENFEIHSLNDAQFL